MEYHKEKIHNEGKVQCKECSKIFPNRRSLKRHKVRSCSKSSKSANDNTAKEGGINDSNGSQNPKSSKAKNTVMCNVKSLESKEKGMILECKTCKKTFESRSLETRENSWQI